MLLEGAKELAADPNPRPNLQRWLFTTLQREVDADRFEGLVPVLEILVDKFPQDVELHRMLGMTAVMTCEYDKARSSMEYLRETEEFRTQMQDLLNSFEELKSQYREELAAREADRQGEPIPTAIIKTTRGNIEVELFENQAPETVANFIYLAETGVFDNTPFHSGKQHFLVQGGGDDVLEPPYKIYGEMNKPGARRFYRGTLGMALSGGPDTAYSQFFFSLIRNPEMDGQFTAFGRVTKGIELMAAITKIDPEESKEKKKQQPKQVPDEILEVEITRKRAHDYLPNKAQ
jgi:cyclophilin family peptidyl-prolyl cis-trans isomerase